MSPHAPQVTPLGTRVFPVPDRLARRSSAGPHRRPSNRAKRLSELKTYGTPCTSFGRTSPSDETLWTISPILARRPGRYRIPLRNDHGPWNRRVGVPSSVEA